MRSVLLVPVALLLVGCANHYQVATYRHPTTGEVGTCQRVDNGFIGGPLIQRSPIYELADYATCKTAAERAGFIRVN